MCCSVRVMLQCVLQCVAVSEACICPPLYSCVCYTALPRLVAVCVLCCSVCVVLQCVCCVAACVLCCSVCVCCCSMRVYMYVCMLSCIPRAGVVSQNVCDVAVCVRCCSVYILLQYVCAVAVCMCCCSLCDCMYIFICVTLHPPCWHVVAACVY